MAVQPQTPYIEHIANGTATGFNLGFDCDDQDHLVVLVNDVEPAVGSWSLVGDAVVFDAAPSSGNKITIQRNTPFERKRDYQSYDNSFRPPVVNKDFDGIWRKLQELGVTNWLTDTDIKNLDAHVNSLNDETRDDFFNKLGSLEQNTNAMLEEAIKNGAVSSLAITTVNSILDLENLEKWEGRTVYVKDVANFKWDSADNKWVLAVNTSDSIYYRNRTQAEKNAERVSVKDFGAIGDGTNHAVSEWTTIGSKIYYSNLAAMQIDYPHVTSLSDSIDWAASQAAIDHVGKGGDVLFNQTAKNSYIVNKPLKFYSGQRWVGCGGVDVLGFGTEIKLAAAANAVAEPKATTTTTYGFNPIGIYFNGVEYGNGLSLYDTSYAIADQCAANSTKDNCVGFLFDADTSKQCYFNILKAPRAFGSGLNGTGIRFQRGANSNQIIGGKAGGSWRGMEFLSLSSGNLVIGTDLEENVDCEVYVDVSNNTFIGLHMENAPIGYKITKNGWGTRRIGTTFASTVPIQVQDASSTASTLDYSQDGVGTFQNGYFRQIVTPFSTLVTTNQDLNMELGTENLAYNFFRNTTTSASSKLVNIYRADGTPTLALRFDLNNGDIFQNSTTNALRMLRRAAAPPIAGAYEAGDKVLRTNPNTTNSVVTEWTCINAGSPGNWVATAWYTGRGTTAQRPTGLTASDVGVQYFDNTLAGSGKPIWWNGGSWVDAVGAIV